MVIFTFATQCMYGPPVSGAVTVRTHRRNSPRSRPSQASSSCFGKCVKSHNLGKLSSLPMKDKAVSRRHYVWLTWVESTDLSQTGNGGLFLRFVITWYFLVLYYWLSRCGARGSNGFSPTKKAHILSGQNSTTTAHLFNPFYRSVVNAFYYSSIEK